MDLILDYSLVPIYFVIMLIVALRFARSRSEVVASQAVQPSQKDEQKQST